MKERKKKLFWLGLLIIAFVYIGFMTYYCLGKPNDPNNITIDEAIATSDTNATTLVAPQISVDTQTITNPVSTPDSDANKTVTNNHVNTEKAMTAETYLCQITGFYELIITLLLGVIGLILGLNFLYIHKASKSQADDMAREALKDESFQIKLNESLKNELNAALKIVGITETLSEIEFNSELLGKIDPSIEKINNHEKRLEFIEKAITKTSPEYKGNLKEKDSPNGNN